MSFSTQWADDETTMKDPERSSDPGSCLHELFELQADESPDAVAVVDGDEVLSYAELDQRANQFARILRGDGVAGGDLVGLFCKRSADAIVSILGILKSGAAYVPLDERWPDDRIDGILKESGAKLLVTEEDLSRRAGQAPVERVLTHDAEATREELRALPSTRLSLGEDGPSGSDLCYIIYTSGTTGRPKGIMTEHGSVVAFSKAFRSTCAMVPEDRVYQGFSLTFDGSVEEIWMAFSSGATLVIGPPELTQLGEETAQYMRDKEVTFFSTVPTFLSMIQGDVPSLRMIVVSGEACPPNLIKRWFRPGLRMLNVYGPTEATVNTTVWDCVPDVPVTIGKPLGGYDLYLLDEKQKPVPDGEAGELYIGGVTLARGYMNQPEVTAKAFTDVELATNGTRETRRLYRTGDLVRCDQNGELLFLGRIDTQVKIRGYRIELAEIESLLREQDGIQSAVVKVVDAGGVKELAAYVVPEVDADSVDRAGLHATLKAKLPAYMLPRFLEELRELPLLTSGKVNRRELPEPTQLLRGQGPQVVNPPDTPMEIALARIWSELFPGVDLNTTDDFFTGLGGHSMLAARMVTRVREEIGVDVALREVYSNPTLGRFAGFLDLKETGRKTAPRQCRDRPVGGLERPSVAIAQAAGIYGMYAILAGMALGSIYLLWRALSHPTLSTTGVVVWVTAVILLAYPALVLSSVVLKWAVIGRYRPGAYPVGGSYYLRWWFVTRFQALSGTGFLSGTPLMSLYFRLMGAKVGPGCVIDSAHCGCFDVIEIGSGTCIGNETQLLGSRVEGGYLKIGRVSIGKNGYVGIHSTLGLNVSIGDGGQLDNLSLLPDGAHIPAGEGRSGSPAAPADVPVPATQGGCPPRRPILYGILHFVLLYVMGVVAAIGALPVVALLYGSYGLGGWGLAAVAVFLAGPFALVCYCLTVVAVKYLVMPRTRTGVYPVESWFYLRKWFVDTFYRGSRVIALPLYTTIYFPTWLRMLGARIGSFAELSTVSQFTPDLMKLGERSFFADGSIIGGRRYNNGMVEVGISEVGDRSFIGNSAMLPINRPVGDDCLIGCLSLPPAGHGRTPHGTDWLGSPSFGLPHRQKVGNFDESVTYRPTPKLIFLRCLVDGMRVLFPTILTFLVFALYVGFVLFSYLNWGELVTFLLAPAVALGLDVGACLLVVVYKRVLLGVIKPGIHPLWSMFVWKNEAVNGAYEYVSAPSFVPMLGTPFLALYLRLLGCKVGRDVYLGTTLFSEWDLVEIGDHAELNAGAVVQNHLFEDRVMKASHLKIGDRCSVGNMAVVLYDTEMKEGAELAPLSLLMKGETVPADTQWCGIPTARDIVSEEFVAEPDPDADEALSTAGPGRRISSIDLLRGLAVLGILLMNIRSFAGPDIAYFNPPELGNDGLWNRIAYYLTGIFADQKFMAIFSMLFGASAVLLSRNLAERGRSVLGSLSLRTFWLFFFGLAHFFLLWNGDVLAVYALCALPLLILIRLPAPGQFGLGLLIFLLPLVFDAGIQDSLSSLDEASRDSLSAYWHPDEESLEADKALHLGPWPDQVRARWDGETSAGENRGEDLLIASLWGNFFARSLGMMLIGMALFRWNILSAMRSERFYRGLVWAGFGLGIPLALYGLEGNLYNEYDWEYSMFLGRMPNHLATIPIAFGYIGLVMLWSRSKSWSRLRAAVAGVGRVALTCYIGQTLLCLFIFCGLGLYGQVDYLEQLGYVAVISVLQLILASFWLNLHRYGPLEWVWRKLSTGVSKPRSSP